MPAAITIGQKNARPPFGAHINRNAMMMPMPVPVCFAAQQSGGKFVQKNSRVRVLAQNGCRRQGGDFSFEAGFHGLCLSRVRNHGKNFFCFQYLLHAHGDGLRRNLRKGGEPTLSYLLAAAGLIEVHDDVRLFGLEIRWRVVEREVSIFADAYEGDVDRSSRRLCAYTANNFGNTPIAPKKGVLRNSRLAN